MSYRTLDFDQLPQAEAYTLLLTAIVPRPIGWISTCTPAGARNAAPFSWFNAVCGDPLMVMAAVGRRRGQMKDTARNIRDTGEFVVNVATAETVQQMVQSSADYPAEVSEFDAVGLTPLDSVLVKPCRIAESPIHIECTLEQMLTLGNASTDLVIGRCRMIHIDERVMAADGRVDAAQLKPVARLGRDEYAVLTELFHLPRPAV